MSHDLVWLLVQLGFAVVPSACGPLWSNRAICFKRHGTTPASREAGVAPCRPWHDKKLDLGVMGTFTEDHALRRTTAGPASRSFSAMEEKKREPRRTAAPKSGRISKSSWVDRIWKSGSVAAPARAQQPSLFCRSRMPDTPRWFQGNRIRELNCLCFSSVQRALRSASREAALFCKPAN